MQKTMARSIALAGNPNCGKTTLFNRLTGAEPIEWVIGLGVNVERKSGDFTYAKNGFSGRRIWHLFADLAYRKFRTG